MIINFIGHMCHVITPTTAHAVIFTVPDHEARLRVRERYRTDVNTGNPNQVYCWTLNNTIVKFSSGGATATKRDVTGLIPVPSLNLLGGAGARLHPDIITPKPAGDFNVFVEMPLGDYGVEDWYEDMPTFNGGKSYFCIPRTITFEAPSTAVWTITGVTAPPTLTPDAVITITNLETKTIPPSHYHYHGRIFSPAVILAKPEIFSPAIPCCTGSPDPSVPLCPDQVQQDLTVECSNSRYP